MAQKLAEANGTNKAIPQTSVPKENEVKSELEISNCTAESIDYAQQRIQTLNNRTRIATQCANIAIEISNVQKALSFLTLISLTDTTRKTIRTEIERLQEIVDGVNQLKTVTMVERAEQTLTEIDTQMANQWGVRLWTDYENVVSDYAKSQQIQVTCTRAAKIMKSIETPIPTAIDADILYSVNQQMYIYPVAEIAKIAASSQERCNTTQATFTQYTDLFRTAETDGLFTFFEIPEATTETFRKLKYGEDSCACAVKYEQELSTIENNLRTALREGICDHLGIDRRIGDVTFYTAPSIMRELMDARLQLIRAKTKELEEAARPYNIPEKLKSRSSMIQGERTKKGTTLITSLKSATAKTIQDAIGAIRSEIHDAKPSAQEQKETNDAIRIWETNLTPTENEHDYEEAERAKSELAADGFSMAMFRNGPTRGVLQWKKARESINDLTETDIPMQVLQNIMYYVYKKSHNTEETSRNYSELIQRIGRPRGPKGIQPSTECIASLHEAYETAGTTAARQSSKRPKDIQSGRNQQEDVEPAESAGTEAEDMETSEAEEQTPTLKKLITKFLKPGPRSDEKLSCFIMCKAIAEQERYKPWASNVSPADMVKTISIAAGTSNDYDRWVQPLRAYDDDLKTTDKTAASKRIQKSAGRFIEKLTAESATASEPTQQEKERWTEMLTTSGKLCTQAAKYLDSNRAIKDALNKGYEYIKQRIGSIDIAIEAQQLWDVIEATASKLRVYWPGNDDEIHTTTSKTPHDKATAESVLAELKQLEAKYRQNAETKTTADTEATRQLQQRTAEQRTQLGTAAETITTQATKIAKLQDIIDTQKRTIEDQTQQITSLKQTTDEQKAANAATTESTENLKQRMKDAEEEITGLRVDNSEKDKLLRAKDEAIRSLEQTMVTTTHNSTTTQQQQEQYLATLQQENRRLQADVSEATQQLAAANEWNERYKADVHRLQQTEKQQLQKIRQHQSEAQTKMTEIHDNTAKIRQLEAKVAALEYEIVQLGRAKEKAETDAEQFKRTSQHTARDDEMHAQDVADLRAEMETIKAETKRVADTEIARAQATAQAALEQAERDKAQVQLVAEQWARVQPHIDYLQQQNASLQQQLQHHPAAEHGGTDSARGELQHSLPAWASHIFRRYSAGGKTGVETIIAILSSNATHPLPEDVVEAITAKATDCDLTPIELVVYCVLAVNETREERYKQAIIGVFQSEPTKMEKMVYSAIFVLRCMLEKTVNNGITINKIEIRKPTDMTSLMSIYTTYGALMIFDRK